MTPTKPTDGNFKIVLPKKQLAFTGERMTSGTEGQIAFEHFHRYCIARDLCSNLDVLDVASGEGYGSAILAGVARSVIGVEIDAGAVTHAREVYSLPNLRFLEGSALALPLDDAAVDVVVSFETLEHIREHEDFVAEVRRVLRPGGLFIVSSPDRTVYSARAEHFNEYHLRELTEAEFKLFLRSNFKNVALLHQRAIFGSLVVAADGVSGNHDARWRSYEQRAPASIEASTGLARAPYIIGCATDGAIPAVASSVYIDRHGVDEVAQGFARAPKIQTSLEMRIAQLDGERADLLRQLDKAYRKPLRPLRYFALYFGLKTLRFLTKPFSPRAAAQFKRSAEKRSPRRFEKRLAGKTDEPSRPRGPFEYISKRYGAAQVKLYRQLFNIVEYYSANPKAFDNSRDCRRLLDKARALAPRGFDGAPKVSIIIPTYNNLYLTLTCVFAILSTQHGPSYEIIVADDRSTDQTAAVLSKIGGPVKVVRQAENLGFIRNCNAAAKQASGDYIVFLNNDTLVLPNWLATLIQPMEEANNVGLVGSKLLNGDGTLQDAGGIVWRDATAWNFGRNQDPFAPEFNYRKEVDYLTGASIAISSSLWRELGGFDLLFLPAYCEDTDLAFRIRAKGLKVIYQPRSEVFHHEGKTHGRDTSAGVKTYQVINQKKFSERWAGVLNAENFENGQNVFEARDRSSSRPHILFIDHHVPQWDRDAGSRTILMYVELLLESGFQISFWPDNLYYDPEYTPRLQDLGVEVLYAPAFQLNFKEWFADRADKTQYVFISRPEVAECYLPDLLSHKGVRTLYYGHDLHYARFRMEADISRDELKRAEAARLEAIELDIWKHVDVVLYPSQDEADVVRARVPKAAAFEISPYYFDEFRSRTVAPSAPSVVFVAGFGHSPNVDAALWLVNSIWPRIVARVPQAKLALIGSRPSKQVKMLKSSAIEVTGWVSEAELVRRYDAARVAVVPLRIGAGVKLKVVEALKEGIPLVTTPVGAQGLPGVANIVDVIEDEEKFAEAVISLLVCDLTEWLARSTRQARYCEAHFSRETLQKNLRAAIQAADNRS